MRPSLPATLVLLLALAALPLWRTLVLGETVGPWGHIAQAAPWNGPASERAWDVLQADGCLQTFVWRDLVLASWRRGELPLWNPGTMCGTPLLANSQSGALYPPHVVLGLAGASAEGATRFLAWAHLALAGLGAALLARRLGAQGWGPLVAGGGFMLSPWMLAWTPLGSVAATSAWIPLCCALAVPGGSRPWHRLAWLVPAVACMVLAGHLQVAFYGLAGAAVAGLAGGLRKPGFGWAWLAAVAGALALGAVACWPQAGSALALAREGHRASSPSPEGAAAYQDSAIRPWHLAAVAYPNVVGLPGQPGLGEDAPQMPGYWPGYVQRGGNFAESALMCGPFVFALLAWLPRRNAAVAASLAGLGLALALGPLSVAFYWVLPGWSSSGSPGRAAVLAVLGLAVAAGIAMPGADAARCAKRPAALAAAGALAACLLAVWGAGQKEWLPALEGVVRAAATNVLAASLPGVAAALVATIAALVLLERGRAGTALLLGLAAHVATGVLAIVPTGRVPSKPEPPLLAGRAAFVNPDWSLFGMVPSVAPPNTARLLGVHEAGGYDSLLAKDSVLALADAVGGDPAPAANGNMMLVKPGFDPEKLAALGVDTVVARAPLPQLGTPDEEWLGLAVYRLPGPGRASTPQGPATVVSESAVRAVVKASGPGELVLRDWNAPGWRARVDGKPASIRAGHWKSVTLGPGEHTVEFEYWPAGMAALPMLGLAAVPPLLVGLLRRNKNLVH